ncbi:MAG: FG-GAP repeat protein [Gammaproteobacteria bacterium]
MRLTRNGKALHYGALRALDAHGKVLPSRMRVVDGRVRLEVAAQEAAYPVIIDPLLTEEAKLLASDGVTGDGFGSAVALSGDGNTALIGAPGLDCDEFLLSCGAAYVFVRKAGGWVEQQKFTGGTSTTLLV